MVILKEGKAIEVTLRVVLESGVYGREYFDDYGNMTEIIEAVNRLAKKACEEAANDGIERSVSVAVIPRANDVDETGHGIGISSEL